MGREIQLILFDVDGTLYDLHDVMDFNYKLQVDFYSGFYSISEEKTVRIFKEHGIFPAKSDQSKSATELAGYRARRGACTGKNILTPPALTPPKQWMKRRFACLAKQRRWFFCRVIHIGISNGFLNRLVFRKACLRRSYAAIAVIRRMDLKRKER